MKSINWLGVIVATIVAFFAGFLWYGLLFEAEWKSLTGVTGEGGDPMWMLLGVVQTFITMAGLGWFISRTEGGWMPQQFENPANVEVHAHTTAREILEDFADAPPAVVITGVGTGGHLTACAEVLKQQWPDLKAYAVEPTLSPVISGGQPGPHPIQGIGAGFIPTNLHTQAIDGAIQVEPEDAKEMARRCAREEGLLVGISSGATLAAIQQKLAELPAGTRVLGFNYDTGERYLSVPDFLPTE